ncbi:hypothetical protein [Frankia sp. Cr2]|uniref:hypothetical protein n=1 Tax=Frankia sp. Cr2 TaxID=3073932 RepID=UPI002AD463BC|nr:hypothetical protein [Frankia sp. Cr2]
MTVNLCETEPLLVLDAWEAVVDVSYHSPEGKTYLYTWDFSLPEDAGNLAHAGPGWYRTRVQTRGRAEGRRHDSSKEPVEEHSISLWPATGPEPDRVHKMDDAFPARR